MLVKRLLVIDTLGPILLFIIIIGGLPFFLLVLAVLCIAAWEYWRMFKQGGYSPSFRVLLIGTILLGYSGSHFSLVSSEFIISASILGAMTVHVFGYEHGQDKSGVDFGITLGGILYFGWLGSFLIRLRDLPNGEFWMFLALPAAWFADTGAYLIGRKFGKHRFSPRTSPKKTWEGYIAGVVSAAVLTPLLALLWNLRVPEITWLIGLIFGLAIGILSPIGDLGESVFKRQFGLKDSSNLLPGHGGMMDRIDTWLWAAIIGYYLALWLV